MRSAWLFVLIAASSVTIARAESAPADTGPPDAGPDCSYDGGPDAAPPAGDVPANWPRFDSLALYPDDGTVMRLVRVSDGSDVSTSRAEGGLIVLEDLIVGEEYDFYHPLCADEPQHITRYRAVAPIAAPSLGAITVSRLYAANDVPGVTNRYYFVDVELDPGPAIGTAPWTDVIWSPTIDGTIGGTRPTRVTRFRTPVACGGRSGLRADATELWAVGGLRSARMQLSTPAVPVSWRCEDALRVDPATLRPLTPDEIAMWDAPPMDGGPAPRDAGARPDTGRVDGGRMGMDTEPDTDSSCAVAHGRRPAPIVLVLILAMIALARRHLGG